MTVTDLLALDQQLDLSLSILCLSLSHHAPSHAIVSCSSHSLPVRRLSLRLTLVSLCPSTSSASFFLSPLTSSPINEVAATVKSARPISFLLHLAARPRSRRDKSLSSHRTHAQSVRGQTRHGNDRSTPTIVLRDAAKDHDTTASCSLDRGDTHRPRWEAPRRYALTKGGREIIPAAADQQDVAWV